MRTAGFSLLIVAADQAAKWLAAAYLRPLRSVAVIPGFFSLSYVENPGAAWGMFAGRQPFLILFTLATLAWLVWKRDTVFGRSRLRPVIQPLLFGGIVGNLLDRLLFGRVVDFLDFHWGAAHFPAFNIADSAICIAVGLCILSAFQGQPRPAAEPAPQPPAE